jgi:hypothetical protein
MMAKENTTGPVGPDGPRGWAGANGINGEKGVDGAQGPMGREGAEGPIGKEGEQGPLGVTGSGGSQGRVVSAPPRHLLSTCHVRFRFGAWFFWCAAARVQPGWIAACGVCYNFFLVSGDR